MTQIAEILIVEDSPTQAVELHYILEKHGYRAFIVGNGIEALHHLKKRQPAVVISDIMMPDMDGYELCRRIKADDQLKHVPVILLTSLFDPKDVLRGLESGADDFFTKPYEERFLLERIQRILFYRVTFDHPATKDMAVRFEGEKYAIPSDSARILNFLLSLYDITIQKNQDLIRTRDSLSALNEVLEEKVEERTAELRNEVVERKWAQRQLFADKERLRVTLQSIGDGVIATDEQGRVVIINPVAEELTGWTEERALGKPLDEVFQVINEITCQPYENQVDKVLQTGVAAELDERTVLVSHNRVKRNIAATTAPIRDNEDKVVGVVLVFRDVSERQRAEAQIRHLSFHDKLTGLHNRAFFEEELKRLDVPRQLPLSLIIGDVNGLKLANDAFGHQEGDQLLIRIAGILRGECRQEDIIARWGGDEFAIVLPETDLPAAERVCERIRKVCSQAADAPIKPSIALGAATKGDISQSLTDVVKEAEDRMYRNKLSEGNKTRRSIISSLQKTLGEKTYETEEHALRLQAYALEMGHALSLAESQLDELSLLAVLHDIGKIAIPDSILMKPASLSEEEWDTMRKHSEVGYRIAQTSYELAHVADSILAHHERRDGTGYPQGLKGDEIPLLSRIIAIVDAYDVMTHERPYKQAISHDEAVAELRRCAGSQFDPELIQIFIELMADPEKRMLI